MSKPYPRSSRRTLLMFLLLGPPIGGVTLGIMAFIDHGRAIGSASLEQLLGLPVWALMGYLPGVVPALVTGITGCGASALLRTDRWWLVVVTATGAASSGLLSLWGGLQALPILLIVGGVAAFASGILSLAVRPVPQTLR